VIAAEVVVEVVRRRTVAGAIIGLLVLLVIVGLIVFFSVAWSRARARAVSAERELAALKQAYAQLDDAYRRSQPPQPARPGEPWLTPPPPEATPRTTPAPAQLPQYPGGMRPPPAPPVS
jgi:type II secretory pathway pseudopilin PulG